MRDEGFKLTPMADDPSNAADWLAVHGGHKRPQSGEERLMLAMLLDAINRYRDHGKSTRKQQARLEAHRWLFEPSEGIFSAESVCGYLDVDLKTLRRRLIANEITVGTGQHGLRLRTSSRTLNPLPNREYDRKRKRVAVTA